MRNLRFDQKLLVAFLFQIGMALCAVIVAVVSLRASAGSVERFLKTDAAHEDAVAELYAQSLQQGLALRNIVLNPGLERAYTNLTQAQADFRAAMLAARQTASEPTQLTTLDAIAAADLKRLDVQVQIVSLAKTDAAAAAALVRHVETPLWRDLRDAILAARKAAKERATASGAHEVVKAERAVLIAVGLAAFAAVVGVLLVMWLRRTIHAELGGDPAAVRQVLRQIADGDLAQTIVVPAGAQASLVASIGQMQGRLHATLAAVRQAVDSVSTASSQIAVGNQDLSSRTEAQAANLEQTAASMDELTSTVASSAEAARQANQLAASASRVAARGGLVVGQVVATMDEISAASHKIADIIGVIDGIAFQTNILALNAAVEAARAGEQGRGFAVVAGEVRSLAQRSAQAAKEIKALIGASAEKVGHGAVQVREAGRTMDDIVAQVKRVTDLMADITTGTQEQSAGISQVNQAVSTLDQMTQQNAALVEQSAAAAASLKDQARQLNAVVAHFQLHEAGGENRPAPRREPVARGMPSPRPLPAPKAALPAKEAWVEF
ncbi:MAG: methyl-accepting chemotaxis protein [Burkholderiaceae bacterium]